MRIMIYIANIGPRELAEALQGYADGTAWGAYGVTTHWGIEPTAVFRGTAKDGLRARVVALLAERGEAAAYVELLDGGADPEFWFADGSIQNARTWEWTLTAA